jgi:hypothetical protein
MGSSGGQAQGGSVTGRRVLGLGVSIAASLVIACAGPAATSPGSPSVVPIAEVATASPTAETAAAELTPAASATATSGPSSPMEEQPGPFWEWVQIIATIVATLLAGIPIVTYATYRVRQYFGPKFRIGSPPSRRERNSKSISKEMVGQYSAIGHFRHRKEIMAKNLDGWFGRGSNSADLKPILFGDKHRCRTLYIDSDDPVSLPIIVENYGMRRVPTYYVEIKFCDPRVHIVDILTESLVVQTLFLNKPALLRKRDRKLKCVSKQIVDEYEDYMYDLIPPEYGDIVYLDGSLDGQMYEMILLKLVVERDVPEFMVKFSIGWTEGSFFPTTKSLAVQAFKVEDSR